MRKIIFSVIALTLLISLNSCSDSEQNISKEKDQINNSTNSKINSIEVDYVTFNDTKYISIDNNTVSKNINDEFVNYFTTSDDNIGETEENVDFSNDFTITNKITNENIKILNIRKNSDFYIFDAETSTGETVLNLSIHLQPQSSLSQKLNPRVILIIVSAILDSLQPSPLQQCTNAMNSLNCKGNTNPYMNFEDGWFSTSCSVGCR